MLAAGTTTWDSLADESYIGRIANQGIIPWSVILGGSYDDAQVSNIPLPSDRSNEIIWHPVGHTRPLEDSGLQVSSWRIYKRI